MTIEESIYFNRYYDLLSYNIVGALCEYVETPASEAIRQRCEPYDDYISSLELTCMNGTHGKLIWTPNDNTPDIVYYQVIMSYNVKEY